ncbi:MULTISPECIES: DUF2326 domain-containing protein [Bacillaceae]|uniref:DUF2326 domain-containing protein n=1 Tax=Evansella alkalicola TaxID=745819 RepID=A0ABS6JZL4_9BACI|nr:MULTISPECIES: DUF2326 domain-containing protein [Bacillaceae]MBU9723134.1 DUF2326 domain-containing protein [Bacillus alkalicola]
MRLIKVSANQPTFKTVYFNKSGLNFIIARKKNESVTNIRKTYNGVGKSLLISIIHFCLGADKDRYKSFCNELTDWSFTLEFEIKGKNHTATRSTANPGRILLNNEELPVKRFNSKVEEVCFNIPEKIPFLSFRSLFKYFIRPGKESYLNFDEASANRNPYQKMLYNSFLLGLDINLANKKYELRKEKQRIEKLESNFRNDDLLKDFFTGQKDVSLTISDLDEKIKRLETNLKNFKVAEDYHAVQLKADRVEERLFKLNNNIILLGNNVKSIERSLSVEPNKDNTNDIQRVYEEANIHFNESVSKTLTDLESFYEKLVTNRKRRLLEQKTRFESEVEEKSKEVKKMQVELDRLMKYLGDHQALDVFVSLSEEVSNLKAKRENLQKYQELQSEYKEKIREIKKDQLDQSQQTDDYLERMHAEIAEQRNFFRTLAKRFYPDSTSGLTIDNNDGDNLQRFDIDAKIESDNSDGINNVKIFCYDLTLLFKGRNHNINSLFHDSRLFDGIDERQKTEMIKVLNDTFNDSDKQYIASVNQNQLNEIKQILDEEQYKDIIEKHVVLELTDNDASEKLLGIQVNIED